MPPVEQTTLFEFDSGDLFVPLIIGTLGEAHAQ
jgi:hypothetical protein